MVETNVYFTNTYTIYYNKLVLLMILLTGVIIIVIELQLTM